MEKDKLFYTLKGYARLENNALTASMEDYLEMIYKIHQTSEPARIGALAQALNVAPSSASKMVGKLKEQGLVFFEKYGYVKLSPAGETLGAYLLFRHNTLHRLLCYINQSENELEQVEKIEHFINDTTVANIGKLLDALGAS